MQEPAENITKFKKNSQSRVIADESFGSGLCSLFYIETLNIVKADSHTFDNFKFHGLTQKHEGNRKIFKVYQI